MDKQKGEPDSRCSPELASLVPKMLPCELRDHAYSYLWDGVMESAEYMKLIRLNKHCPVVKGDATEPCAYHLFGIPVYAQKRIMGGDFVYEAASWLYKNREFDIDAFT
ncbi:hypothetical protein K458DRAFT_391213 [Lentithecium fluviatile CBS 122367]|uniref:Uncharacterized protein n=1 Tax=Lentithecium fluviatile CBS 122367 TaxID=1168545 RepID=A0A6G1IVA7_9PLEO|nr:hypothetical protein K458DRAFT_391213 [Lentithecium fluviatile CBS 122367]